MPLPRCDPPDKPDPLSNGCPEVSRAHNRSCICSEFSILFGLFTQLFAKSREGIESDTLIG